MKNLGIVCACAVRYALGRSTYVTSVIPEFIISHMKDFDSFDLENFLRDISTELSRGNYGDPNIDLPIWENLMNEINQELSRRS